jgi:hypothetical protein
MSGYDLAVPWRERASRRAVMIPVPCTGHGLAGSAPRVRAALCGAVTRTGPFFSPLAWSGPGLRKLGGPIPLLPLLGGGASWEEMTMVLCSEVRGVMGIEVG